MATTEELERLNANVYQASVKFSVPIMYIHRRLMCATKGRKYKTFTTKELTATHSWLARGAPERDTTLWLAVRKGATKTNLRGARRGK